MLRYDRAGRYRLLSAQSTRGGALYVHYGLDPENYETNILLIDGVALIKAEGSIRLAMGLGFPWSLAGVLRVLPRRVADVLYEWVARNRFRMFGRRETCYLPRTVDREFVHTDICSERVLPNCRGVIDPVAFFETESLS